jgi:hypothetical protein
MMAIDFGRRIFSTICAYRDRASDVDQRPAFMTYGHDSRYCEAIKPDNVIATEQSLAMWLSEHEFFDGEIEYADPWPCEKCVTVEVLQAQAKAMTPKVEREVLAADREADVGDGDAGPRELALDFVRHLTDDESFPFLLAMRAKLDDNPNWTPTENQATAILKCARRGSKKGGTRPAKAGATDTRTTTLPRPFRDTSPLPFPTDESSPAVSTPDPAVSSPPAPTDEPKTPQIKNPDAPATDRQVEALVSLAKDRTPDFYKRAGETVVRERARKLTKGEASSKISELLKMPKQAKQASA